LRRNVRTTPKHERARDGDRGVELRADGPDSNDELLTKDEAAQILKVAVRYIDRCVVERRIRYVRFGRYIRIPRSAIDEYVAASMVDARPATGSVPRLREVTAR
jgi:excisionase family DNA binding protein